MSTPEADTISSTLIIACICVTALLLLANVAVVIYTCVKASHVRVAWRTTEWKLYAPLCSCVWLASTASTCGTLLLLLIGKFEVDDAKKSDDRCSTGAQVIACATFVWSLAYKSIAWLKLQYMFKHTVTCHLNTIAVKTICILGTSLFCTSNAIALHQKLANPIGWQPGFCSYTPQSYTFSNFSAETAVYYSLMVASNLVHYALLAHLYVHHHHLERQTNTEVIEEFLRENRKKIELLAVVAAAWLVIDTVWVPMLVSMQLSFIGMETWQNVSDFFKSASVWFLLCRLLHIDVGRAVRELEYGENDDGDDDGVFK